MKKRLLLIFVILAITATGIIGCGKQTKQKNSTSSRPSGSSAQSSSSSVASSSNPGVSLPAGWDDNGIFSAYYDKAYQKLLTMSTEEKVGQMILARCPQQNAVKDIQTYHLGGFVLFAVDFENKTANQVISTISAYQNASSIPMIMSVDEEGGTVVRISSNPKLAENKFASPHDVYESGGLSAIRTDTLNKAKLLKGLGLNVNLAPVSDVSTNPSDYIYPRALGKPAQETGQYVATVVQAMQESGLSSTLKHFPGYGNNADTHTGIAIDNRPYSTFENSDFIPFEDGINAGAESILVSHNIVECMDKGVPASLSPAVHQILRNTLHFTGVIMTDDLSMDAIKDYTHNTDPAVKAVLAGNDMLMMTDYQDGYSSVLAAVKSGAIPEQMIDKAVFRVLAWKYARGILK
jgi:beta-N-acetylhexosaminidase